MKPSRTHIGLAIALLAGLVFLRPLLLSMLLVIVGGLSTLYKRHVSVGLDVELCSLCAVAIGSAYGAVAGALANVRGTAQTGAPCPASERNGKGY